MPSIPNESLRSLPPRGSAPGIRLLRLWFGVSDRVGWGAYALSGLALSLFKYAVEAYVVWQFTSAIFWPWDFLNPVLSERTSLLQAAPEWLPWAWFLWTLPFLWVAVTMSVRRAADAGSSPWLGLLVLIPIINLVFMFALCLVPSRPVEQRMLGRPADDDIAHHTSAVFAVGISLIVGGLMLWTSVYLLSSYGASLFLGTPLLMGATASYLYNRPHPRSYFASVGVGLASVCFASLALLLFAIEGVICIAMATPLMLPIGALGGVLGKAIADASYSSRGGLVAAIVALPLLAGGESLLVDSPERVVRTHVDIDAPAAVVWANVIAFPPLPVERAWYFSWGISCPERAEIIGTGVGATRRCVFTTGTFVEPITTWDEPQRLAFDVAEQPAPLFELSPYRHIHPPHLDGYLRSTRGEFLLIALPDGRTRLQGSTWYQFEMYPQWYWTIWSDSMIHRIHQRVLGHIKRLSEIPAPAISKTQTEGDGLRRQAPTHIR